jgi:hypothetical protein
MSTLLSDPRLMTTDYRHIGDPNGTRTRVSGVRGRRPGPLDDGTNKAISYERSAFSYKLKNFITTS